MQKLNWLHLEFPFSGSRRLRDLLAAEGCKLGRRHVKTLIRRMGIAALYRRPRTTKIEPGDNIYPYLLRGMEITPPHQVWAMNIIYIPAARGLVYLAVVLRFNRRVLSSRLDHDGNRILRRDAGRRSRSRRQVRLLQHRPWLAGAAFTGVLASLGMTISMDGRGAWRDDVFV